MEKPEGSTRDRPRFSAYLAPPSGSGPPGSFRNTRLLGLAVLLALTLVGIYALQRSTGPGRAAVLITPFQPGVGNPGPEILEDLTDRLAARISRLPEVKIVLLARDRVEDQMADFHLTGKLDRQAGEYRIRLRLRALPNGNTRDILSSRAPGESMDTLLEEIAGILATVFRRGTQ